MEAVLDMQLKKQEGDQRKAEAQARLEKKAAEVGAE